MLKRFQILSDPSGNSFVENPHAPRTDPLREVSHFLRTREQDHALGLYTAEEIAKATSEGCEGEATLASAEDSATEASHSGMFS